MKLVDYSDSDASDSENEAGPSASPVPRPQQTTLPPKPAKKQIIVDLPKPSRTEDDEPVRKRMRTEGDGKGLFAILPPPKRSKPAANGNAIKENDAFEKTSVQSEPKPVAEPSSTPSFVPRSTIPKTKTPVSKPAEAPPVSLFPLGPDLISKPPPPSKSSNPSAYEPLIAQPLPVSTSIPEAPEFIPDTTIGSSSTMSTADLDNFAAHILEGRHRKNRTIEIVDYNAAEIYAQNAADKASGLLQEQAQPVRAIGTGRHQLTQLLNNVQDQRESLEEAFAQGRRVRKESAAKYGW